MRPGSASETARRLLVAAAFVALGVAAHAQTEATLDVLDGETLYEDGWLITLGTEFDEKDELQSGWHSVPDPADTERRRRETVLAAHYGLRNDLQLSWLLPQVRTVEESTVGGVTTRTTAEGWGDAVALLKWRFHRWDAPHQALNMALLAGAELPTGDDREKDDGVLVPSELQPASGSLDPMLGVAATYEPGRWRFNAAALYTRPSEAHDHQDGDELFLELAAGNRFWLEPYPGPFMRFDLILRHRHQGRDHQDGALDHDTGGDLTTLGANLAFRPRPSLDFQVGVETPVAEQVEGTQLAAGTALVFNLGYRF